LIVHDSLQLPATHVGL